MAKLQPVALHEARDPETLRKSVENELNRIVVRLNDQTISQDVDLNNNRVTNVKRPSQQHDAVNVEFLEERLTAKANELVAQLGRPNLRKAYGFSDTEFTIGPGGFSVTDVVLSSFTFDPTHFDIDGTVVDLKDGGIGSNLIGTGAIATPHLYAGAILVGGGTNRPTQFTVYNHYLEPVGWIGDDYGSSGYDGAWFKRVLVGGTSPATAGFFADAAGNAVMKSVWVYNTTGTVGWVGNQVVGTNTYYGGWFKQLYVGGTGPTNAPLYADANGNAVARSVYVLNTSGTVGWIGSGVSGTITYTGAWLKSLYAGGTGPANAPLIINTAGNLSITNGTIGVSGTDDEDFNYTVTIEPNNIYGYPFAINGSYGTHTRQFLLHPSGVTAYQTSATAVSNYHYFVSDGVVTQNATPNLVVSTAVPQFKWTVGTRTGTFYFGVVTSSACVEFALDTATASNNYVNFSNMQIRVGGTAFCESDRTLKPKSLLIGTNTIIDTAGKISAVTSVAVGTNTALDSNGNLVSGAASTAGGIGGAGFNVYQSGWYYGVAGPSTFTAASGEVVVVRGGIIVSIT